MLNYVSPDNKYRNAKYILPYVIGFFFLLSAGQLAGQLFTVAQLNKVAGKINDLHTRVRSYGKKNRPNYVLTIVLNGKGYDVEDTAARAKLGRLLNAGEQITLYYPTTLYRILCAGIVHSVSQVELDKQVVYSFDEQKRQAYLLVIGFAGAACVFWGVRYSMLKKYGPVNYTDL